MNSYLLDTNIVIGILNGHHAIVNFFDTTLAEQPLAVSEMTRIELLGFPDLLAEEEQKIQEFMGCVEILSLTRTIADQTIALRRQTQSLKLPDAIIAATAIIEQLTLVSCDSVFEKDITHLKFVNPCSKHTS
jgi:hypothetical protein